MPRKDEDDFLEPFVDPGDQFIARPYEYRFVHITCVDLLQQGGPDSGELPSLQDQDYTNKESQEGEGDGNCEGCQLRRDVQHQENGEKKKEELPAVLHLPGKWRGM